MDDHHLRAIILKLQDRLTNNDRQRLQFYLGDDVPQRIQDNPSFGGTFCRIESLFDQDEINEQDLDFLINAFDEIQCIDAVKLLKVHMKRVQANRETQSVQSLTSIMPHTIEQIHIDLDEDRSAISNDQENISGSCTTVTDQKNTDNSYNTTSDQRNTYPSNSRTTSPVNIDNDPVSIVVGNQRIADSPPLKPKQLCNTSWTAEKCLIIFIILSIILLISLIGVVIALASAKSDLKKTELECFEEHSKNNETIQYLKNVRTKDSETIRQLSSQPKANGIIEQLRTRTKRRAKEPRGRCKCDSWCRRRGHQNGGICGDGYTCICSP